MQQIQPVKDPVDIKLSEPVLTPGQTYISTTKKISEIVLGKNTPRGWYIGFGISFALLNVLMVSIGYLFVKGVGIWGLNNPVAWGFAIVNFVWWIGIGHAGTLISAILLLFRQEWRTSINRFAEAMTLFAVASAGIFPIIHLGRPWFFYWTMPLPNTMGLWPQFRSPLVWDVFAISTYAMVSLMFWYVGLIPDLATMRDRATKLFVKRIYGVLALGWRGAAKHWHRYQKVYLLLAAISTPLVVSVHTIVSLDFTVGIIPGWHSTIFPPYFVDGAIYSGFAMVVTLMIPLRKFYGLEKLITNRHLNNMAKIMLVTGSIVFYSYLMEMFFSWYSGNEFESYMIANRFSGPYAPFYWVLLFCNAVIPQALWSKKVRANHLVLWIIAIIVNIGMWLERFIIVVTSTSRDFLPSSWGLYVPTFWDYATYIGTIGLFLTLIFLFIRVFPAISMFEVRELIAEKDGHLSRH